MLVQSILFRKFTVAYVAFEQIRLVFSVVVHVLGQMASLREALVAHGTLVGFLPRVGKVVLDQGITSCKPLLAVLTLVGFLIRVDAFVLG